MNASAIIWISNMSDIGKLFSKLHHYYMTEKIVNAHPLIGSKLGINDKLASSQPITMK